MRNRPIFAAGLLALAPVLALGAADDAEARGRGARAVARIANPRVAVPVATGSIAVAAALPREGADPAAPGPVQARAAPAGAQPPSPRTAQAARPWCEGRRLVGSGTGFCLVN